MNQVAEEDHMRDRIFASPDRPLCDFVFDGNTAAVFDDMVDRSVPLYSELQRMTCELAADFTLSGTRVYDIGCATGTTMMMLDDRVSPEVDFVGIDNSDSMLNQARVKLETVMSRRRIELVNADLDANPPVSNASVILMVLTLQFVRPLYRDRLVRHLYDGLTEHGCLILVEKILGKHGLLNRQFIKHYYEMKRRNGYSDMEIAGKREALENVLVPYQFDENVELLHGAGFSQIEEFFRWYNFCGLVAVK